MCSTETFSFGEYTAFANAIQIHKCEDIGAKSESGRAFCHIHFKGLMCLLVRGDLMILKLNLPAAKAYAGESFKFKLISFNLIIYS